MGLSYDFDSIMHYARNTFSKSTYLDTILPQTEPHRERPEIGQRVRLSVGDIAQTNRLYKCPSCGRTLLEASGSIESPNFNIVQQSSHKSEDVVRGAHSVHVPPIGNTHSVSSKSKSREEGKGTTTPVTRHSIDDNWMSMDHATGTSGSDGGQGGILKSGGGSNGVIHCEWRIAATHGERIVLNVSSLQIYGADGCEADYLEIRDGYWPKSPLLGKSIHLPADTIRDMIAHLHRKTSY